MRKSKLYAPAYYRDFVCIADKCRHTCCVGWEIDVDNDTYERYKACTDGYGAHICETIDTADGETPHFRLCAGDRCPHLASNGLCNIITELGDEYLCDICREHPRFYHETPFGMEVGLGMACEEACRLILESDEYAHFEAIEDLGDSISDGIYRDFDALAHRADLYATLSDRSLPYPERLARIRASWRVSPAALSDEAWQKAFAELEYLDDRHRTLFSHYSSHVGHTSPAQDAIQERALAYFIFRHASPARDERDFRAAVGFSLLCERLLASIADRTDGGIREAARIISEELEYSEENTEALMRIFNEY